MFSLNKPACLFIRGERYDPCYQIYDCQRWLATSKLIRSINHLTSLWNLRLICFSSFSKLKRYMMIRDDSLLKSASFLSPLSCWNICWGVLIVGDSLPQWELCPVTQHVCVRYRLFGNLLCANSFIITLVKYGQRKMWGPLWTSCQRFSSV